MIMNWSDLDLHWAVKVSELRVRLEVNGKHKRLQKILRGLEDYLFRSAGFVSR